MENKLLKTLHLSNGLILYFYDRSKKIAGDRWQVTVIARIDIPVDGRTVDETQLNASLADVKNLLGNSQVFEKMLQRNFIDARKKDSIVGGMVESLETVAVSYLSNKKFAMKYVVKRYREAVLKQKWVISE
jgi:hypothetical protein